jgi:glycosyltransferase involved in cell wall biosynthesis
VEAKGWLMKVVHLIDSGGLYGAEMMLLSLIDEQKKQGIAVDVISMGAINQSEKELERELKERKISVHALRISSVPSFSQGMRILNICRSVGGDIIHSHGYKGNILLGMLPRVFRKIPVVTTLHGYTKHNFFSKMTLNQFIDKCLVRFLDAIILVSPTIASQINLMGVGSKVFFIPNGVNQEISSSTNLLELEKKDNSPSDFVIGSIGRLCIEKNYLFIIRTMPKILNVLPNAKLVIHGEGSERQLLESEIRRLNLEKCVFLPGYVDNPHAFLKTIDLYVNCSITEGMPITILEAMRAKCLVLASNILANKYLLENKYPLDMLYDFENDSFVEKFKAIVTAPEDIKNQQKENLYSLFVTSFTSASMAEKYTKIYEKKI